MFKNNLRIDRGVTGNNTFRNVLDLVNNPGARGLRAMRYFKLCVSAYSTSYILSLRRKTPRANVLPHCMLFGFLFVTTMCAIKHNKRHQNAASRLDSQQVARVCGGR